MGVSFKVSKSGTRYRSKPLPLPPEPSQDSATEKSKSQSDLVEAGENITRVPNSTTSTSSETLSLAEREASFTLNLFPDGYSIGKPFENDAANQSKYQDFPKLLHPYDRSSESLFLAIESGHLPGDILDDIPAKYVDGALICEVRDYRKCSSEKGAGVVSTESCPTVNKVCLKMSLENIVKDIPSITDKSWTYGDLMEVESKILKALQPNLHLDPTPKLERLCESPLPTKLNLRRKRLRHMQEFSVTSSNKIHGKKVCIDRVQESPNSRLGDSGITTSNAIVPQALENSAMQNLNPSITMTLRPKNFIPDSSIPGFSMMSHQQRYAMPVGTPRSLQEHGSVSSINSSGASPAAQDVMISYTDNANSSASLHAKRENQDGQASPLSHIAKRLRPASTGVDAMQQQQIGSHVEALQGSDMNWQNTLLQQQAMARGMHYASGGMQKFPQQVFEGGLNPETGAVQFASSQQGMRLVAKEEQFEMEKLDGAEINRNKSEVEMDTSNLDPQQLRLQQRLSHNAFMRPNFPQSTWNNLGQHMEKEAKKEDQLQKRKSVQSPRLSSGALAHSPLSSKSGEFSNGTAGPSFGPSSLTAAPGASQKEKTAMASVPAAVGTPSLTSSANDSAQRQQQAQLAAKRRSNSLPKTPAMSGVSSPASVSTGVPLNANSPSVGTPALVDQGTQNMLERFSKIEMVTMSSFSSLPDIPFSSTGNMVSLVSRLRTMMIMSEKPSDGTVAMHYGDIDDGDFIAAEDHLPTLPNTHFADLLAKQFCSQMAREGYVREYDRVQLKPNRVNLPLGSQSNVPPNSTVVDMQQYGEPTPGQSSNEVAKSAGGSNASLNLPQNPLANTRMLPPGTLRPYRCPKDFFLQNPQFQRSSMMLGPNQLSHLNAVGQNSNMPLVGLAPMGNPMGMGAARGIGGTGISAPMTSIAGMGNMGQNPMNLSQASNITNSISQQFRPGTITSTQADILSKLRMPQNRGSMLGSPQSSIAGISGARQMHPGSAGGITIYNGSSTIEPTNTAADKPSANESTNSNESTNR
ncbi:hypothetical protein SESBI_24586 [Sesbania bispinosa]|nr:hypothetical protein SESBI_24586 [Sesbania bispinosa]